MEVFIAKDQPYSATVGYMLRLLATNKGEVLKVRPEKGDAALIVDHIDERSVPLALPFYEGIRGGSGQGHEAVFHDAPVIRCSDGRVDHLATAFYMINALQEHGAADESRDGIGRFRYESSYQHRFGCVEENLVQQHLDAFCAEAGWTDLQRRSRPTRVFLSHDIDTVHGSFLQDGFWAMKHGRLDVILRLVFNEIMGAPGWVNFDRIHKLHDEHDLKSTFFFLATRRRGPNGLRNADYSIARLSKRLGELPSKGLHKSTADLSFMEELARLPFSTTMNRYHFLRFELPGAWYAMEAAGIELDASLGFAERFGFRNNYGLPFHPYDLRSDRAFRSLEVPLNIMDGTLHRYMGLPPKEAAQRTIAFLDSHRRNAVISILWHNTYFTPYKYRGFLEVYKTVLAYLKENGITSITPTEMLDEHRA